MRGARASTGGPQGKEGLQGAGGFNSKDGEGEGREGSGWRVGGSGRGEGAPPGSRAKTERLGLGLGLGLGLPPGSRAKTERIESCAVLACATSALWLGLG